MLRPLLRTLLVLSVVPSCDCGDVRFRDVPTMPRAAVEPSSIAHDPLCAPRGDVVKVRNDGDGALTVTDVSITGSGWTLTPVTPPIQVDPGTSLDLSLSAAAGDAVLRIATDDPRHPEFVVPLHAKDNTGPNLTIVSPTAAMIAPDGADLVLTTRVRDDDPPGDGVVHWAAESLGVVGTSTVGADGTATTKWSSAGRPHGPTRLTATAVDACGLTSSAEVPVCLDGTYRYRPFELSGWQFNGSARFDAETGTLLLTPAQLNKAGSAFELSQSVGAGDVEISFGFFIGNGTGADGFSLTALDQNRMTSTVGPKGCGIGYGGNVYCTSGEPLPGWAVEVDTFYNLDVDPTRKPHVAFSFDGQLLNQPLWAELPAIADSMWHSMHVKVRAPRVTVTIDDVVYLDGQVEGNFSFPAFVGFTAATGGQTDEHRISALEVEGRYCGDGGLFPVR